MTVLQKVSVTFVIASVAWQSLNICTQSLDRHVAALLAMTVKSLRSSRWRSSRSAHCDDGHVVALFSMMVFTDRPEPSGRLNQGVGGESWLSKGVTSRPVRAMSLTLARKYM